MGLVPPPPPMSRNPSTGFSLRLPAHRVATEYSLRIEPRPPVEILEYKSEEGKWKKFVPVVAPEKDIQYIKRWGWLHEVKHNVNASNHEVNMRLWKIGSLVFFAAAIARILIFGW